MKIKYCLPIIKASLQEAKTMIDHYANDYDLFEVWIDYLTNSSEEIRNFIVYANQNLPNKIIIVFRRQNGEPIHLAPEKRYDIISLCHEKKILIDVDIEKQKDDLSYIKNSNHKLQLITSYHNYKDTPRTNALATILKQMHTYNPTIYKIATFCQSEKQALALMHLLIDAKEQEKKVIIIGMGEYGKITRIFGALYGNEINFVSKNREEQSAKGQLTRKELETIVSIIKQ